MAEIPHGQLKEQTLHRKGHRSILRFRKKMLTYKYRPNNMTSKLLNSDAACTAPSATPPAKQVTATPGTRTSATVGPHTPATSTLSTTLQSNEIPTVTIDGSHIINHYIHEITVHAAECGSKITLLGEKCNEID